LCWYDPRPSPSTRNDGAIWRSRNEAASGVTTELELRREACAANERYRWDCLNCQKSSCWLCGRPRRVSSSWRGAAGNAERLRKGVDIAGNASDFRHRDGTTKRYLAYRLARERPDLHSKREYQDGRDQDGGGYSRSELSPASTSCPEHEVN
jgi:hypothetical protein